MNRFEYGQAILADDEASLSKDKYIKLYDGDEKTNYDNGEILLTTHRLLWGRIGQIDSTNTVFSLKLKYIQSLDEELAGSFFTGKKKRLIINLKPILPDKLPGPHNHSNATFIKLSGSTDINASFVQCLREALAARIWDVDVELSNSGAHNNKPDETQHRRIKLRTGIVGIERSILERQKQTDENISMAFKDLNKLMIMAKDMVNISKTISQKIRERQGDISEDETIRFKSYLMSLGIDDPVTKDNYQSSHHYYTSLAQQISQILLDQLIEVGGMMSMADVYCRVNRARGLELVSPEDLLNACKQLQGKGPIRLRTFPSGAMVLQLESHDDAAVVADTSEKVNTNKSLTTEQLAQMLGISIVLAQERLLTAERCGTVCRDESIQGLQFYPNLFLNEIGS